MSGSLTVAVIGHVNHGKTALVRALTGIETDRLPEEIARGLSITLGFAWRDYESGTVDLIDSPGHEDFIRATASGVAGARAILLVVSAAEGFGRQTVEHLQIAGLLGIDTGLVAVTKADLLSPSDRERARTDIEARLAGSVLARAPVVLCSSVAGEGVGDLHQRLADLRRQVPAAEPLAGAFLPIDRAFTMAGAGTVVTGALQGGALHLGADAVLQPSGRRVGLRQIQVHGADVDSADPGGRVAVGLRGVSIDQVKVGDVLCAPDAFVAVSQVDVQLAVAPDSPYPVKHMDEMRVLWGARRDVATVRTMGARSIAPGESGLVQLRFPSPVVAFAGQRAVLRRLSPARTVAGALVLDPAAPALRGKPDARLAVLQAALTGDPERIATALADQHAGLASVSDIARLARRAAEDVRPRLGQAFEVLDANRLARRESADLTRAAYCEALLAAHRQAPARAAANVGAIRAALAPIAARDLIAHAERTLAADGLIRLDGSLVALSGHDPFAALTGDALANLARMEDSLRAGGVAPPDIAVLTGPDGADADLLQLLVESGRAVRLRNIGLRQTVIFHRDALAAALDRLRAAYPPGSAFTTGEARALLETSRKFIVPLLEHFDATGQTQRDGDVRRPARA